MAKHHPENERIKRKYLTFLQEAKRMSTATVDQVAAAIALFEQSTGHRSFKTFHIEQAKNFKRQLNQQINEKTRKPLAKATIHSRLMALKAFVQWLAGQQGYKSRISYSDAEYFNPSANDTRIAKAERERPVPTLDQIRHVLDSMPTATVLERRDRALIAFTSLTGARDDAIASMLVRHVNLDASMVDQDARDVRTKNRKTFPTFFFPVGDEIETIVRDWIGELISTHKFGPSDPLFPATKIGLDAHGHFAAIGIKRECWSNAAAIRRIFKQGFEAAGLPYFNPHSFRKTLAVEGERVCSSPEEFKSWSQNLGHDQVLTTLTSYGVVGRERQASIFKNFKTNTQQSGIPDDVIDLARALHASGVRAR